MKEYLESISFQAYNTYALTHSVQFQYYIKMINFIMRNQLRFHWSLFLVFLFYSLITDKYMLQEKKKKQGIVIVVQSA